MGVAGKYAYVAGGPGLLVIDVSDPTKPAEVSRFPTDSRDIASGGGYVYIVGVFAGLRIIDVSEPAHPVEVAHWRMPGSAEGVALKGGCVFLSDHYWGLLVFRQAWPGSIAGRVRVSGTTTNIEGALIEAYLDGELVRSAVTRASGVYRIPHLRLPSSDYVLVIRKPGFLGQTVENAAVAIGATTYVRHYLEPG